MSYEIKHAYPGKASAYYEVASSSSDESADIAKDVFESFLESFLQNSTSE